MALIHRTYLGTHPNSISGSRQGARWRGAFAPSAGPHRGALSGTYVGASGAVGVGVGACANPLFGGTGRSIASQPLSLEGSVGINLSLGVSSLRCPWRNELREEHPSTITSLQPVQCKQGSEPVIRGRIDENDSQIDHHPWGLLCLTFRSIWNASAQTDVGKALLEKADRQGGRSLRAPVISKSTAKQ